MKLYFDRGGFESKRLLMGCKIFWPGLVMSLVALLCAGGFMFVVWQNFSDLNDGLFYICCIIEAGFLSVFLVALLNYTFYQIPSSLPPYSEVAVN